MESKYDAFLRFGSNKLENKLPKPRPKPLRKLLNKCDTSCLWLLEVDYFTLCDLCTLNYLRHVRVRFMEIRNLNAPDLVFFANITKRMPFL